MKKKYLGQPLCPLCHVTVCCCLAFVFASLAPALLSCCHCRVAMPLLYHCCTPLSCHCCMSLLIKYLVSYKILINTYLRPRQCQLHHLDHMSLSGPYIVVVICCGCLSPSIVAPYCYWPLSLLPLVIVVHHHCPSSSPYIVVIIKNSCNLV